MSTRAVRVDKPSRFIALFHFAMALAFWFARIGDANPLMRNFFGLILPAYLLAYALIILSSRLQTDHDGFKRHFGLSTHSFLWSDVDAAILDHFKLEIKAKGENHSVGLRYLDIGEVYKALKPFLGDRLQTKPPGLLGETAG